MRPRDHDRPGCGGRRFAGFSGSRRLHGRPSRKGDGRGYQGPGCGRSGGTERSRHGGNWGTAEVPRARGCGAGGVTKVARLAKAGGCRAAEAIEVARGVGARGFCAAGAAKAAGWDGAGCWAESPERKDVWPRSATAMAAVVGRS